MSELGITNIVAIEYADKINELAELLGKGRDSLSVLLEDDLGNQYMACHSSAWTIEDYESFTHPDFINTVDIDLSEYTDAIENLIWNVVPITKNYNAIEDNWNPTLLQYGLHRIISDAELNEP